MRLNSPPSTLPRCQPHFQEYITGHLRCGLWWSGALSWNTFLSVSSDQCQPILPHWREEERGNYYLLPQHYTTSILGHISWRVVLLGGTCLSRGCQEVSSSHHWLDTCITTCMCTVVWTCEGYVISEYWVDLYLYAKHGLDLSYLSFNECVQVFVMCSLPYITQTCTNAHKWKSARAKTAV